jgi:hypothetical protein
LSVLADSAIAYAQTEGLHVFPLQVKGKIPLTPHGLDDATTDYLTIETWWDRWPDANIAIRTGDIVVIDEDRPGALTELARKHGEQIPETRIARTGKGRHYYFTQPPGQRIRNTAGKLAPGVDTRGDGGYVVAPPSIHPDGGTYEWESTAPPTEFPAWLASLLAKPERKPLDPFLGNSTPYGQRALEAEIHAVATAGEGTRNDRLNTAAFNLGQLISGRELDEHDARVSLQAAARACGLPDREAEQTIKSGLDAGLAEPRSAPEPAAAPRQPTAERRLELVPEQTPRISIEPWETFNRNSQAELEFVVTDLWPARSFAFIASPPKKGKTWLGLAAAISIATGKPFIASFDIPVPRRVLYLALEGARAAIRARIGALARGLNIDPDSDQLSNLDISYRPRGINLADPGWAAEIANIAAEHEYAVILVDVLRNAARIKESDQAEFSHLRSLLEPALAHTSIALLHHFTKLSELSKERTPAERMSGSGAMYGALDVGLFITGSEQHARKLRVEFDGRDIAMPDPVSVYLEGAGSGPNGSLLYTDTAFWHGGVPEVDQDDLKAPASAIAEWVREQGGEVLMSDVLARFEISDDTLRNNRRGPLERLGIDWIKRSNKVHLIDRSHTLRSTDERESSDRGFGTNSAWLSEKSPETDNSRTDPIGTSESADLQAKPNPDKSRSPTEIDASADGSASSTSAEPGDIDFG